MIDNGVDLSDFSMLDLFRSEMEVHAATLNDGLLALESDPGATDNIESLMRAAHSIKGGARIVDLDPAVKLAHIMEDCFVATQRGEISLGSDEIDILLKAVDMLVQISDAAGDDMDEWLSSRRKEIDTLVSTVGSIISGNTEKKKTRKWEEISKPSTDKSKTLSDKTAHEPAESEKKEAAEKKESDPEYPVTEPEKEHTQSSPPKEEKKEEKILPVKQSLKEKPKNIHAETQNTLKQDNEKDRMVRVTAGKIERLMGLAGEVVVGSKWLSPFLESLVALKKTHMDLTRQVDRLQEIAEMSTKEGVYHQRKSPHTHGEELMHHTTVFDPGTEIEKMLYQVKDRVRECNKSLMDRMERLEMYTRTTELLSDRLYHEIIGVRMRPFSDGVQVFPRMVRDIARELGKKVNFEIEGKNTDVDRDILEKLEAPLSHLLRNAIDHGIEPPEERIKAGKPEAGTIRLQAVHRSGMLMITVTDDGKGVDLADLKKKIINKGHANDEMVEKMSEPELMEFLFLPGFSTLESVSEISGRGVGLDVVHSMVHEVRGIVRAVSRPGRGLSFHLELPLTLSVVRTFIVEISKETYAFPLARIDRCLMLQSEIIETVEDRQYFRFEEKNIALVDVYDVLELTKIERRENVLSVVVISDRVHSYGIVVDSFLGECDLVVRPLDGRLGKISNISSMAVMMDGSPVLVFDVEDMVRSIDTLLTGERRLKKISRAREEEQKRKHILVVDDSITVREMERKILESRGYRVDVAVDGVEAWNLVRTVNYDMVVSDIDMPRMNGIELIANIKSHEKLRSLPVMVVSYKNKEEDRLKGLEAGADYYLTKSSFQDNSFIDAVYDMVGEARIQPEKKN